MLKRLSRESTIWPKCKTDDVDDDDAHGCADGADDDDDDDDGFI